MRIHSNTLTPKDIFEAATGANVVVARLSQHGSRSRQRAYEVNLSGSGRRGGQWGNRDTRSATWDEYGIFLNELFQRDPELTIPRVYPTREAFHWITADRYHKLTPSEQHILHRWRNWERSASGVYTIQHCDCGAAVHSPGYGYKLADVLDVVLGN